MHEDFQRFRAKCFHVWSEFVGKKKKNYSACLLSEMQGIIAFTLYIDPINIIELIIFR